MTTARAPSPHPGWPPPPWGRCPHVCEQRPPRARERPLQTLPEQRRRWNPARSRSSTMRKRHAPATPPASPSLLRTARRRPPPQSRAKTRRRRRRRPRSALLPWQWRPSSPCLSSHAAPLLTPASLRLCQRRLPQRTTRPAGARATIASARARLRPAAASAACGVHARGSMDTCVYESSARDAAGAARQRAAQDRTGGINPSGWGGDARSRRRAPHR